MMRFLQPGVGALALVLMAQAMVPSAARSEVPRKAVAHHDVEKGPRPTIIASQDGEFGLKRLPNMQELYKPPTCIAFSVLQNGQETVVWKRVLINKPDQIRIEGTGYGPVVFTIGNRYSNSHTHYLVIYNPRGKVISDFNLETLLTAEELADLPHTGYGFSITDESKYWVDWNELTIRFKSGRVLIVSLDTGQIIPKSSNPGPY